MPEWQLNPLLRLTWRDWGGDSVVFDATSGQTHQFDRLTAAVAASIAEAPRSTRSLCDQFAAEAGLEHPEQLLQAIDQVVDRLHLLGWVRPLATAS